MQGLVRDVTAIKKQDNSYAVGAFETHDQAITWLDNHGLSKAHTIREDVDGFFWIRMMDYKIPEGVLFPENKEPPVFVKTGIKCKVCGDEIFSEHRHDFRYCSCRAVFVDGGNDYLRCGGDLDNMEYALREE